MSVLSLNNVKKSYKLGDGSEFPVLKGINVSFDKGELVSIIGESGSGKSTLMNIIGGLDSKFEGEVLVDGKNIGAFTEKELDIYRKNKIGFIFQNYNLIGNLTVLENITLPIELDGNEIPYDFINEILHVLKLEDKKNVCPNKLSGGQQQRVAIARALATRPSIILADEPTGNLDSKTTQEVIGLIKRTSHLFKQTIVMITHNEDIAQLADRIIKIEDGKLRENNDE